MTPRFNPWVGCEKVSPGCAHCYAETLVQGRMDRAGTWGADGVRERTSESNWKKPLRWQRLAEQGLMPGGKTEAAHRPRVFCASLADVFEPRPELAPWRDELFLLIEQTPSLDWLILTKRPEEARDWLRRYYEKWTAPSDPPMDVLWFGSEWTSRDDLGWGVLRNVWVGVSIENARHTWRADVLREIPAAVRFISAEPLLGSLYDVPRLRVGGRGHKPIDLVGSQPLDLTGIDWLIVGGESGRDARPMHPEWARELRDACLSSGHALLGTGEFVGDRRRLAEHIEGVYGLRPAFFFKQYGSWAPVVGHLDGLTNLYVLNGTPPEPWSGSQHGATTSWDVQARTGQGDLIVRYAGVSPKSGGKLLDGREWCEFPNTDALVAA